MKAKLYTLLLSFVITISCIIPTQKLQAQYVAIPDTNFVKWLNTNGYSACMNGNLMDTTCAAVVNATSLNCSSRGIQDISGIQYFLRLQLLDCGYNFLQSLPSGLPDSLKTLNCYQNQISGLPALPLGLTTLNCAGNHLTNLPLLNSTLTLLDCSSNQLANLPSLNLKLNTLRCSYNQISSLPSLSPSIGTLSCDNNQLSDLPTLCSSLIILNCSFNLLTNLPTLPLSLINLVCRNNQLTDLPDLPTTLTYLDCDSNQLTTLSVMPDYLSLLYCNNNPNLACLPPFTRIDYLNFSNTAVTCIPDYGSVGFSTPSFSSLPLCRVSNPNGCAFSSINTINNETLSLTLLPNPAHNYVMIQTTETTTGGSLRLSDMQGREVLTAKLTSTDYRLDTGHLSAGLYLVKVIDLNGRSGVKKLLVE